MAQNEEDIDYRDGDVLCKGRLIIPEGDDQRPGVVIFPDISGVSEHSIGRARRLAKEFGYVALVADLYGNGESPPLSTGMEVVKSWLTNPDRLAKRGAAALDALKAWPRCNGRLAAIGFCFGGGTVLAIARSGNADMIGGVSFHGVLGTVKPAQAGIIKSKLMVLHGADDPFAGDFPFLGHPGVTSTNALAFTEEMSAAKIDCQLVAYCGAVHAFTIPTAGDFGLDGAQYHALTDQRSWRAMADFLGEVL